MSTRSSTNTNGRSNRKESAPSDRGVMPGPLPGWYDAGPHITTITYAPAAEPAPPPFQFKHDRRKHRFRITGPDGQTAQFKDRPARFLVMARDPKTRTLKPVVARGEPLYYYLSPEVASK